MENTISDQREHKRHTAPEGAIAACHKIVCRIIDISEGGMALHCISKEPFSEEEKPMILCRTKGLFIKDLPIKLVRKTIQSPMPSSTFQMQTVGVSFNYKNTAQRDQIKAYISELL